MLQDGGRIGLKGGADAATESFSKSAGSTSKGRKGSVTNVTGGGARFDEKRDEPTLTQVERPGSRYSPEEEDLLPGDVFDEQIDLPKDDPRRLKEDNRDLFINKPANYEKYVPTGLQTLANLNRQPNRKYFYERVLKNNAAGLNYTQLEEEYEKYMAGRMSGETDAMGNPINQGQDDGSDIQLIPFQNQTQPGTGIEPETEPDPFQRNFRLMADGGMTNDAPVEGGIIDLESGRQMYGLGKLVKKATRAVKKIAKSPIGKAALMYFGGNVLAGGGLKSFLLGSNAGPNFSKTGLLQKMFLKNPSTGFSLGNLSGTAVAGIPAALSYFMTPEEEEQQAMNYGADIDEPDYIMNNPDKYTNRRLVAGGGLMRLNYAEGSKEPVAKKTMPLLDMDGQEMDLREEGGFVPLGRMERADDVPARLSKNEFVFTADAVRNAGDGDVDKGAEVMYNMMKNLESGGDVSEESQGLEGAREMFQTSQRLEEVI